MANYKYCANGHGYDAEKHTFCPYCASSASSEPMSPQMKTTIAGGGDYPHQYSPNHANKPGVTRVVMGGGASPAPATFEYVVGWLVIVNGKGRGRDLRIPPGQCKIGRDRGDITLPFGDDRISREKHAYITYVQKQNSFIIQHGEGKNLVEVNGEPVIGVEKLAPFDHIRLGGTDLIFVPLCGDRFDWSVGDVKSRDVNHDAESSPESFQSDTQVKTKFIFE